ncbi:MAG: ATP-binding protein [Candidatus Omnitrophota bacterium]
MAGSKIAKLALPTKFILAISGIIILTSATLSYYYIKNEIRHRKKDLLNKGEFLVKNIAVNSEYGVLTANKQPLVMLVEGLLEEEDVVYCLIQSREKEILALSGNPIDNRAIELPDADIKNAENMSKPILTPFISEDNEPMYNIMSLIKTKQIFLGREEIELMGFEEVTTVKEELIGFAQIGISLAHINNEIKNITIQIILLTAIVIIIGIIITFFLVGIIIGPIRQLVLGTQKITAGDLTYQVNVHAKDEIGILAKSFNQMTAELKRSRNEIENYSRTLEQKVEERTKELKEAQAQLVQSAKMAAVGQLGAGVAHELNNPLGGILGYSQFMLEKFKRPNFGVEEFKACNRYIESIERESTRCKKIVESLLKFSRKPIFAKQEVLDINHAIEETISIIGHQLKLKNINLVTSLDPDLSKTMGITNQLQQVFTNIILNAQQAMPDGGDLTIVTENMRYEGIQQSPWGIKIEFSDTGMGIPEKDIPRIFEPFYTTKTKDKGTGLGLAVSYQIIKDHQGAIEVVSEEGKGTKFIIFLPPAKI